MVLDYIYRYDTIFGGSKSEGNNQRTTMVDDSAQ